MSLGAELSTIKAARCHYLGVASLTMLPPPTLILMDGSALAVPYITLTELSRLLVVFAVAIYAKMLLAGLYHMAAPPWAGGFSRHPVLCWSATAFLLSIKPWLAVIRCQDTEARSAPPEGS